MNGLNIRQNKTTWEGYMLSLSCSCGLRLIQSINIGATESIFPEVEEMLNSSDYQQSLEYVAAHKNMNRYRSTMDFLFCELYPEWRFSCFRFYADKGPQLRYLISSAQIKVFGEQLIVALEVAHLIFCEKRRTSWRMYHKHVKNALAA